MLRDISDYLCPLTPLKRHLKQSLGVHRTSRTPLRFEQVMAALRDTVDPHLSILDLFDRGSPSLLHYRLADAIARGASVLTTNFDSLLEIAYYEQTTRTDMPVQVALSRRNECPARTTMTFTSFASQHHRPALLKLHGTLRSPTAIQEGLRVRSVAADARRSIIATLDRLTGRFNTYGLEPAKERVLRAALRDRVLVVMGYSGSDTFDVIPSLERCLPQARAIIWCAHMNRTRLTYRRRSRHDSSRKRQSLKAPFLPISTPVGLPVWRVNGSTARAAEALFLGPSFNPMLKSDHLPAPTMKHLTHLPPYLSLSSAARLKAAGRLLQLDGNVAAARRAFTAAIRLARHAHPHDNRTIVYSYSRLGALALTEGNPALALREFRRGLELARRIRYWHQVHAITSNIGNVYLQRGELTKASNAYRYALSGHRRFRYASGIAIALNNLGLIARKRGRLNLARSLVREALEVDRKARDLQGMLREYGNLANLARLRGHFRTADRYYKLAIRLARQLPDETALANNIGERGALYTSMHRFREARQLIVEALERERVLRRRSAGAENIARLGALAEAQGNRSQAIEHFRKSLQLAYAVSDREGIAERSERLGLLLLTRGKHQECRRLFKRSLSEYQRLGNSGKAKELRAIIDNVRAPA